MLHFISFEEKCLYLFNVAFLFLKLVYSILCKSNISKCCILFLLKKNVIYLFNVAFLFFICKRLRTVVKLILTWCKVLDSQ